ncbi:MAG: GAF domain-containing protein [Burkholderiaceae bacterium]|nr:GAF domain-containing protein [Burkholderiaceae bacterium]
MDGIRWFTLPGELSNHETAKGNKMGWFFSKKSKDTAADEIARSLNFSRKLQIVTNRIHSTANLDQLMLEMSGNICDLFNCDRLTLFALAADKKFIYSKIKTGIESDKDLVLPVSAASIAGWVALSGRTVRIRDVYDNAELRKLAEDLHFSREVDQITGYRTRQMLAAPIFRPHSTDLLGVIQLLNNRNDSSFTAADEEGIAELAETLAIAYAQRMKPPAPPTSKYDALIADAVISQAEFELATRSARRQSRDVEDVLIDEFQVALAAVGEALAKTYKLPYESWQPQRKIPEQAIKKITREFTEDNQCVPIDDDGKNIVLLTTDPERTIRLGAARRAFPYASLFYRVTTKREFQQTVDRFFAGAA